MSQNERSWSTYQFSDTPEYWNGIAPFFSGLSAENLRSIHFALLQFEQVAPVWKDDEIRILIASVYENLEEPMDTPEWWGKVAANLSWRTALDCRIAFRTYGISDEQSKTTTGAELHQQETMKPPISSNNMDTVITSSKRNSQEHHKAMSKGKQQQQLQPKQPSVPKGKQQQQATQPCFPSSTTFSGGTFSQRTSVVLLKKWTLEDYIFLMKALTRNLHVDTDDEGAMERIASLMVGKTSEEVRHLILKWRPRLLAALEKADRITGP